MARKSSFAARLAELERLDAEREQERDGADPPPDVAALSDAEVLAWVIGGLRHRQLHIWYDWRAGRIWLNETCLKSIEWELFFRALKRRAQPIVDANYAAIAALTGNDGQGVFDAVISVLKGLYAELTGFELIDWSEVPTDMLTAFVDKQIGLDDVLSYLRRRGGA